MRTILTRSPTRAASFPRQFVPGPDFGGLLWHGGLDAAVSRF